MFFLGLLGNENICQRTKEALNLSKNYPVTSENYQNPIKLRYHNLALYYMCANQMYATQFALDYYKYYTIRYYSAETE